MPEQPMPPEAIPAEGAPMPPKMMGSGGEPMPPSEPMPPEVGMPEDVMPTMESGETEEMPMV